LEIATLIGYQQEVTLGRKTGIRETYLKKIEAQLDEWQEELEDLSADTYRTHSEAEIERVDQIEALRRQRQIVWNQLQTMKEMGDETWEELKTQVEDRLYALRRALDRVSEQPEKQEGD
jgi:type I site-specific restriction endonuclease